MSHHKSSAPQLTTQQINDSIESGKSPEDTPGSNWSFGVDDDDVSELDTSAKGLEVPNKNPASVILENANNATFDSMDAAFNHASGMVGFTQSSQWQDIGTQILDAMSTFKQDMTTLDDKEDWTGKTHDAAMANLNQSFAEPQALINGIGNLSKLLSAFTDTIYQTSSYFKTYAGPYSEDLTLWPHHAFEVKQGFDSFAQKVMSTVYQPNIQQIADENPAFSSGQQVNVNTPPGGPDGSDGSDGPDDPPPPDFASMMPSGLTDGPPPPPADPGGPPPPPNLNGPNLDGVGGPNDPNGLNLHNLLSGAGGDQSTLGSGLSNLLGGPSGDGSDENFDPSQLPGGPNTDFNAMPPGGSDENFDPSQLPGGPSGGPIDPNSVGSLDNLSGPPNVAGGDPNDNSSGLGGLNNLGSGLSGLGSPGGGGPGGAANSASGLGNQLSSAVGPAADALKQAEGAGQPPGGMQGLNPKGLNTVKGAGPGGAHAGGGGGGAGIGGRGLDPSRPGGVPIAGFGKGPALADTGATRLGGPGYAGGVGRSGSGSPSGGGGGGQRGPGGKDHKASKALRRKRNGELVIGEPDAVVPVIGDDGPDTEATEPSMPEPVPAGAAPPARRPAPAASVRRPGAEQLRAELEL